MVERINVRCQRCKKIFEVGSDLIKGKERDYICARCNKETGEVSEKEEINRKR